MDSLRREMPIVDDYRGPGHIASGQALIKHLDSHQSCFSFLSEFGHVLKIITNRNANAADLRTKQVLLDLFSKSGRYQMLHSSVYADVDKNTKTVRAPCFAFMGDTTPDGYYDAVSDKLVSEGLIPRFLTIEYDGPRVRRNQAPIVTPHPELVEKLKALFTSLANMFHSETFVDIRTTDDAQAALDAFDEECDEKINDGDSLTEIWNRAHLKVLRIAGLVAVGRDHFEPVISKADVEWARSLVLREIDALSSRFDKGQVGEGETRQSGMIEDAARHYLTLTEKQRKNYGVPQATAIKAALNDSVELGILQELSDSQAEEIKQADAAKSRGRPLLHGKTGAPIYAIGPELN